MVRFIIRPVYLQRTPISKAGILRAAPAYRDALLSAFKEASSGENPATLDAGRLRELVKFALAAVRNTSTAAEGDQTKTAELWRASDWSDVLDALRWSDRFKNATGLTNALKQVVSLLGGGQNGAGATVEAGKYVMNGVYVGAKQDTGGGTTAQVQVDLTQRLKVQATVNTGTSADVTGSSAQVDKGSSLGLSYQFDY